MIMSKLGKLDFIDSCMKSAEQELKEMKHSLSSFTQKSKTLKRKTKNVRIVKQKLAKTGKVRADKH